MAAADEIAHARTSSRKKDHAVIRERLGRYRISRHLHVPANQVYAVAHKNNFRRPDGVGYPTPPENEARFIAAVRAREDYSKRLARRYKIGICKANRLAHEILATHRFRPGLSRPVLDSNFPQRWPKTEDDFAKLALSIAKLFGGSLPPFPPEKIVRLVIAGQPNVQADAPLESIQQFSHGLVLALRARSAEDSLAPC